MSIIKCKSCKNIIEKHNCKEYEKCKEEIIVNFDEKYNEFYCPSCNKNIGIRFNIICDTCIKCINEKLLNIKDLKKLYIKTFKYLTKYGCSKCKTKNFGTKIIYYIDDVIKI